ncbi:VOC family protein [Chelativorans xinjiangense]|uniref:VOC family protein n=1 Tax=Chelativorans xinjiangense TaxID=2681485 RepID=UPI0013574A60|nr:VOC family protein [Chelativorans xinjiangense]
MKPRISVITIGVNDLEASLKFYRDGLGLPTEGIIGKEFEHGAVAFFDLQNGVKLALFPRADIAHDAGIEKAEPSSTEFTLGHNVMSESEVDAVMDHAVAAGARLIKPAQKSFWGGYTGYFQDPDGHLWEVVYNQAFLPED